MKTSKTANANQIPVEENGSFARYNVEHPHDGNQSLSIEVTKATGRWNFEIVWFDEKAEDWDGMEATYSEVKAAGFQLPTELYSVLTTKR
jgi:hypothetical protein